MKLNSLMQTNFLLSFPRSSRRNFFTYSSFFLFRLLIINHSKRWIRKKVSFDSFIFYQFESKIIQLSPPLSLRIEKYSPRVGSFPKESREAIREICKFQVTPLLLRRPASRTILAALRERVNSHEYAQI